MGRLVLLLTLACATLVACGDTKPREPPTDPDAYLLEGHLLDAETGEPVSRKTINIHAFNDAIDHQVSLECLDVASFALRMPQAKVRLRVADGTRTYALYEKQLTLDAGVNAYNVALVPTHYVRLHGHLVDGETGERVPRARHREVFRGPCLIYVGDREGRESYGPIWPDDDGGYAVRVPRSVVEFQLVSTPESLVENTVDLTDHEGDAYEFDLRVR